MPTKRPIPATGASAAVASVKPEDSTATGDQAHATANDAPASSAAASPSSAPSNRPASTSRPSPAAGRGGKPTVTPKPKFAGRRSQAARQEAEQAEAKKKAAEAEAAAAEAKKFAHEARRYGYHARADRTGRGRGRGRGGHMGDSFRQREEPVASGPFSSGKTYSETTARRTGWASGGGGGGAPGAASGSSAFRVGGGGGGASEGVSWNSATNSQVKTEHGMSDPFISVKLEDGGYISSEDEEAEHSGPKQNIDQMQVIDLTGEDDPGENQGLAPVRLLRMPHKERTLGLTAGSSDDSNDDKDSTVSEKKKGKQRAKDVEVTGAMERQTRPAAYSSSDTDAEPTIKKEPTDDDQQMRGLSPERQRAPTMDAAVSHQSQAPSSSPESKRKAKAKIQETADAPVEADDFSLPPKPRFETQADETEWHRKFLDLKMLRDELGSLVPKSAQQPQSAPDTKADTDMTDLTATTEQTKARQGLREQATYLFQFPPVLPGLTPINVKSDPEFTEPANTNGDTMDLDTDKDVAEGTENKPDLKTESKLNNSQPTLPSGAVGKLKIHKSGRATLDWGGTSLFLGMGADTTFLQNVMIAKMPDKKPSNEATAASEDQEAAHAMGMGQVRGKFVVTPDWEEILK